MNKVSRKVLPQNKETEIQTLESGVFDLKFAYARKNERLEDDSKGEDFLVFQQDGEKLAFALCDGVGSSFLSFYASELVGNGLVNWLWDMPISNIQEKVIEQLIRKFLNELSGTPSDFINNHAISDIYGRRSVIAMEQKREKGAESVFIAGLLDTAKDRLIIIWMGDSRFHLWDVDDKVDSQIEAIQRQVLLDNDEYVNDYWSSRKGAVGNINVHLGNIAQLRRIAIYSDGLKRLDDQTDHWPSPVVIQEWINGQNIASDSDDISYLEIILKPFDVQTSKRPFLKNMRANVSSNQDNVASVELPLFISSPEKKAEIDQISDNNYFYDEVFDGKDKSDSEIDKNSSDPILSPVKIKQNGDDINFQYSHGITNFDLHFNARLSLKSVGNIFVRANYRGTAGDWSQPQKLPIPRKTKMKIYGIIIALMLSLLVNLCFVSNIVLNSLINTDPMPTVSNTVIPTPSIILTQVPEKLINPTQDLWIPSETVVPLILETPTLQSTLMLSPNLENTMTVIPPEIQNPK